MNYYFIGKNEKYKLYIIKKLNYNCIDRITLATWKLINIWDDIHFDFKKLSLLCGDLRINISKDDDTYILINIKGVIPEQSFYMFQNILQLMHIKTVNLDQLKITETDTLHKKFLELEYISTIVDTNVISVINKYLSVVDFDIYVEIAHYKSNVSSQIIRYLFENYNIYKIEVKDKCKFIIQIDDVFCECSEYGTPCEVFYFPWDKRTYNLKDLICNMEKCKISPEKYIENITRVKREPHNYKKCIYICSENCEFRKTIMKNLENVCVNVYDLHNSIYRNEDYYTVKVYQFDIDTVNFILDVKHILQIKK